MCGALSSPADPISVLILVKARSPWPLLARDLRDLLKQWIGFGIELSVQIGENQAKPTNPI